MRAMVLIVAVVSAVIVVPVRAQDKGFYLGGEAGLAVSTGLDLTFTPGGAVGTNGRLDVDHKRGFAGSIFAGYDFGRIRIEAEGMRLGADVDELTSDWSHAGGLVVGTQSAEGEVRARSALLNLMVDFGREDGISFFVGGGAGKTKLKVSGMALSQGGSELLDDEDGDWRTSWQALAGVRKSFSEHLELQVRYRYLDVSDLEMIGLAGRAVSGGMTSHSIAVGVAYRF